MRISFVLPLLPLAGGIKIVLRFSNELALRGHHINVIFPAQHANARYDEWFGWKSYARIIRHTWQRRIHRKRIDWFELHPQVALLEVHDLREQFIPDADVVVATGWSTAHWVNSYRRSKGNKFYLIQHYEDWDGPRDQVDATWIMPLHKIVIARWLKELAEQRFGQPVDAVVNLGIDLNEFCNPAKIYNNPPRIGMLYHTSPWKGIADGLRAFEIVRAKYPKAIFVMFGVESPRSDVSEYIEYHYRPTGERLRKLYSSLDIFVSPSWAEGFQAPPMEAMACQCAVVATNVGGVPEYTIPGETALVVPPHKPEQLAEKIIELLDDSDKLKRISQAGFQKMREFTWDVATDKLEAVFAHVKQRGLCI